MKRTRRSTRTILAAAVAGMALVAGSTTSAHAVEFTKNCGTEGWYIAKQTNTKVSTKKKANSTCGTYRVRGQYVVNTTGYTHWNPWTYKVDRTISQTTDYVFIASQHDTSYSPVFTIS